MKLRHTLIAVLTILLSTFTSYAASTGSIKTSVIDKDAPDLPIVGAVAELSPVNDPEMRLFFATDGNGELLIPSIKYGDYTLNISFLGYTPKKLEVSLKESELKLPNVLMESTSVAIDAVVKEVKALRASQKGDTLNYNAAAFKVADDADAEGLLSKMPGISIEDGEVSAQGETVKRVFVDGREFFGGDVSTALKSLPAEVVERIEVYDNLSDNAKFTGIDDGNGEKAINIVTKSNMRQGAFGKVYGGYGYEPDAYAGTQSNKYIVGGNVNLFQNTSRITLLGLYNNVNQRSFSFEDIIGVGSSDDGSSSAFQSRQQPGVSKVQAFGLNYSNVYGKDDKLKVQGSYFYNDTNTINEENVDRWYDEGSGSSIDSLEQRDNSLHHNNNHRINGKIDWEINDRNSLMIRPTASFQNNDQFQGTYGVRYKPNDIYQIFNNWRKPISNGYNIGTSANYRTKVGDKGSTVTFNGNVSYNNSQRETFRVTEPTETYDLSDNPNDPESVIPSYSNALYRDNDSNSHNLNLRGGASYNAYINEKIMLSTSYNYSTNRQESDQMTLESNDPKTDPYEIDPESSNDATSTYTSHKIGPSFRYKRDKSYFVASVNYQHSKQLNTTYLYEEEDSYDIDNNYDNITYSVISNININPENSLRFYLNSYTENPSIHRLQDIYSISGDYITKGNPYLDPSYTNRLSARYIFSDLEKGRTLMFILWGQVTNNFITTHVYLDPNSMGLEPGNVTVKDETYDDVVQYTTYKNLNDYYNVYGRVNYGLPLDFMKCNLNVNAAFNYSVVPSIFGGDYVDEDGLIVGGKENSTNNMSYNIYTVLGSNISDKIDFKLTWSGKYSEATNTSTTTETGTTKNRYWEQGATATMKFIFKNGITIGNSTSFRHYKGITNDYDEKILLCNAYVGYRVFKNRRGEINVGVNDIFNDNKAFYRYIGNNYAQNRTNLTMGRYYTAQFIYNLRMFGRNASKNINDYEGMGGKRSGGPRRH